VTRIIVLPKAIAVSALALAAAASGGCGSPPSVIPVLRVVERVLADEAQHIVEADALRDRHSLDQARRSLSDAYRADLAETETLSPHWVQQATDVYVAAREALLRQEFDLARQRGVRIENLRLAAEAQSRAIAILQQQDRLLMQTVGLDLWRLDAAFLNPTPKDGLR